MRYNGRNREVLAEDCAARAYELGRVTFEKKSRGKTGKALFPFFLRILFENHEPELRTRTACRMRFFDAKKIIQKNFELRHENFELQFENLGLAANQKLRSSGL